MFQSIPAIADPPEKAKGGIDNDHDEGLAEWSWSEALALATGQEVGDVSGWESVSVDRIRIRMLLRPVSFTSPRGEETSEVAAGATTTTFPTLRARTEVPCKSSTTVTKSASVSARASARTDGILALTSSMTLPT